MRRNLIIVVIVLFMGMVYFVYQRPQAEESIDQPSIETAQTPKAQKTAQRTSRKGPKKPPASIIIKIMEEQKRKAESQTADIEKERELQEKRDAYFEKLDEAEDPDISELTMLGEMAFYANEPEAAYDHYLEVIDNHSDEPTAPFALYKFAWVQYNLGDVENAMLDMELVLDWIETGDPQQEEMLRQAAPADYEFFQKSQK